MRPRDHFGVSIHFLLPIAEFTEGPAHCREADRQPKCKTIGLSSRRGILSRNGPALGTAASRGMIVVRLEGRRFCVSQRTLSPRKEPRRTTTAGNTRPGVLCVLKILPAERLAPASPNPTEHPIGRCCAESDLLPRPESPANLVSAVFTTATSGKQRLDQCDSPGWLPRDSGRMSFEDR